MSTPALASHLASCSAVANGSVDIVASAYFQDDDTVTFTYELARWSARSCAWR